MFYQKAKITKFDVQSSTFDIRRPLQRDQIQKEMNVNLTEKKPDRKTVYSFYLNFLEMLLI